MTSMQALFHLYQTNHRRISLETQKDITGSFPIIFGYLREITSKIQQTGDQGR
jgi:hypothetical protein